MLSITGARKPPITVDRLIRYPDSGEYDREIREVADDARDYLEMRMKHASKDEKLAAIFDIDKTFLSSWEIMSDCGFLFTSLPNKAVEIIYC
ncbi:MAG TPA: HAD family acid phosphatase [Candidatus Angelobacter sp.]|jgi:hypothetical protein